jgi:hypothetical protein
VGHPAQVSAQNRDANLGHQASLLMDATKSSKVNRVYVCVRGATIATEVFTGKRAAPGGNETGRKTATTKGWIFKITNPFKRIVRVIKVALTT